MDALRELLLRVLLLKRPAVLVDVILQAFQSGGKKRWTRDQDKALATAVRGKTYSEVASILCDPSLPRNNKIKSLYDRYGNPHKYFDWLGRVGTPREEAAKMRAIKTDMEIRHGRILEITAIVNKMIVTGLKRFILDPFDTETCKTMMKESVSLSIRKYNNLCDHLIAIFARLPDCAKPYVTAVEKDIASIAQRTDYTIYKLNVVPDSVVSPPAEETNVSAVNPKSGSESEKGGLFDGIWGSSDEEEEEEEEEVGGGGTGLVLATWDGDDSSEDDGDPTPRYDGESTIITQPYHVFYSLVKGMFRMLIENYFEVEVDDDDAADEDETKEGVTDLEEEKSTIDAIQHLLIDYGVHSLDAAEHTLSETVLGLGKHEMDSVGMRLALLDTWFEKHRPYFRTTPMYIRVFTPATLPFGNGPHHTVSFDVIFLNPVDASFAHSPLLPFTLFSKCYVNKVKDMGLRTECCMHATVTTTELRRIADSLVGLKAVNISVESDSSSAIKTATWLNQKPIPVSVLESTHTLSEEALFKLLRIDGILERCDVRKEGFWKKRFYEMLYHEKENVRRSTRSSAKYTAEKVYNYGTLFDVTPVDQLKITAWRTGQLSDEEMIEACTADSSGPAALEYVDSVSHGHYVYSATCACSSCAYLRWAQSLKSSVYDPTVHVRVVGDDDAEEEGEDVQCDVMTEVCQKPSNLCSRHVTKDELEAWLKSERRGLTGLTFGLGQDINEYGDAVMRDGDGNPVLAEVVCTQFGESCPPRVKNTIVAGKKHVVTSTSDKLRGVAKILGCEDSYETLAGGLHRMTVVVSKDGHAHSKYPRICACCAGTCKACFKSNIKHELIGPSARKFEYDHEDGEAKGYTKVCDNCFLVREKKDEGKRCEYCKLERMVRYRPCTRDGESGHCRPILESMLVWADFKPTSVNGAANGAGLFTADEVAAGVKAQMGGRTAKAYRKDVGVGAYKRMYYGVSTCDKCGKTKYGEHEKCSKKDCDGKIVYTLPQRNKMASSKFGQMVISAKPYPPGTETRLKLLGYVNSGGMLGELMLVTDELFNQVYVVPRSCQLLCRVAGESNQYHDLCPSEWYGDRTHEYSHVLGALIISTGVNPPVSDQIPVVSYVDPLSDDEEVEPVAAGPAPDPLPSRFNAVTQSIKVKDDDPDTFKRRMIHDPVGMLQYLIDREILARKGETVHGITLNPRGEKYVIFVSEITDMDEKSGDLIPDTRYDIFRDTKDVDNATPSDNYFRFEAGGFMSHSKFRRLFKEGADKRCPCLSCENLLLCADECKNCTGSEEEPLNTCNCPEIDLEFWVLDPNRAEQFKSLVRALLLDEEKFVWEQDCTTSMIDLTAIKRISKRQSKDEAPAYGSEGYDSSFMGSGDEVASQSEDDDDDDDDASLDPKELKAQLTSFFKVRPLASLPFQRKAMHSGGLEDVYCVEDVSAGDETKPTPKQKLEAQMKSIREVFKEVANFPMRKADATFQLSKYLLLKDPLFGEPPRPVGEALVPLVTKFIEIGVMRNLYGMSQLMQFMMDFITDHADINDETPTVYKTNKCPNCDGWPPHYRGFYPRCNCCAIFFNTRNNPCDTCSYWKYKQPRCSDHHGQSRRQHAVGTNSDCKCCQTIRGNRSSSCCELCVGSLDKEQSAQTLCTEVLDEKVGVSGERRCVDHVLGSRMKTCVVCSLFIRAWFTRDGSSWPAPHPQLADITGYTPVFTFTRRTIDPRTDTPVWWIIGLPEWKYNLLEDDVERPKDDVLVEPASAPAPASPGTKREGPGGGGDSSKRPRPPAGAKALFSLFVL